MSDSAPRATSKPPSAKPPAPRSSDGPPTPIPLDYRHAVYAGSFDPPTNGHRFLIEQASLLFERVTIAVGVNPNKQPAFATEKRLAMLRATASDLSNVQAEAFSNDYLVHFAAERGIGVIIRGIRSFIDYDFEHRMRQVNADIDDRVMTAFLMPPRHLSELSSSFIKGLVGVRGWERLVEQYVPPPVMESLREWARSKSRGGQDLESD